ncbi:hypothetical protein IFM89_014450 [Coptis chinensis]|uniref:Receptor-like serine/threonine-protein kinase n=1 Tax=Coptis chinensis TaxID=261450 RepID=A0A835I0X9_9MAGN|nr:hypothetical protein IFM89_014450 [Coptis chinensis]
MKRMKRTTRVCIILCDLEKKNESKSKRMAGLSVLIFYCYILIFISQEIQIAAYTLTPSQSMIDGQTILSQGETFELGFFSPSNSNNRYLGIWYKTIPTQTVVWVANRNSPLNGTSGVLKIDSIGNLVIVNQTESVLWSSNLSRTVANPIMEFLESGNIVLRNVKDGNSKNYMWQSFDYPGDTLLPGMKVGWNLRTGMDRKLTSWRSFQDPSDGDYTYGIDLNAYFESSIRNRSNKYYRSGPWNGIRWSGAPDLKPNPIFTFELIHNDDEIYYIYQLVDKSVIMRLVLLQTSTEGNLQRLTWVDKTNSWLRLVSIPRDRCDDYALCGVYSSCDVTNVAVCQCLKGFKPKSPTDWYGTDWSEGCERVVPVNCSNGEGFLKFTGVKLPDTTNSWVNISMNLEECRLKCLNNCSCMAYTNSDVTRGGRGCVMWFADLIDIRQLNEAGEDLYIRMAASELGEFEGDDVELPFFDLVTIKLATNNFSEENKLGQGGFGPVYKGELEGVKEIAVKRLSKNSVQGGKEFKNEVILISGLQHRNLVKLLGCCIQGEEKMLVYEYMPNKSLDSSIFDKKKSRLLDWQKRLEIILGIARGLLYLHHDSRLRIIHRDLKASNILLDSEMVPKISDFGMARMFGGDQMEANTRRVVGTYGYMAPEYAVDGHFSVKSDVFSFGVLVLEIISGKKNRGFCHPDHEHNLLGHAWRLWSEDRSMELVDESMSNSYVVQDVLRCIHVGLLCVQKGREERPTMSSVVLMLSSESVVLPKPQRPGFYVERSTSNKSPSNRDKESCISSSVTITMMEGR